MEFQIPQLYLFYSLKSAKLQLKEKNMFQKIMVPLDGSKLAECALTYAETLAQNCSATEVVLVSITERLVGRTRAPEAQEAFLRSDKAGLGQAGSETSVTFGKMTGQAWRYLDKVEKKMKAKGIPVRSEVLMGNPAESITKFAEEEGIDLIVMSSHGRSGPSRWALGSVTDKVFRATCVPVLMVRAPGCITGF
jgi:nucleotide-binding universal stress UspA family protein